MDSITVVLEGHEIELTYDNTLVFLFKGIDTLDHAQVCAQIDGEQIVYHVYDPELLSVLGENDFPLLYRVDRPEWAVERRMNREVDDLDRLLESGESGG